MENYSPKIIPKIFMRYYEMMAHTLLSEEEKQLTKLAFSLLNMRIEKNISQDEVIEKSGLSKSVVSRMETFKSIPSSVSLAKYANALGMELILVDSELFKKWKERSKPNKYL